MTICSDIADYQWLTGEEACGLLNELAEDTAPLHTAVARLRAHFSLERTHLLIEQVDLRRRAAAKFTGARSMFFTRTGLEQATDEWVAAYKATRFPGLEIKKRGVDIDPEKLRRDLKLRGDNGATLLITHIAGRPAAVLAHRVSPTSTRPIQPLLESTTSGQHD